MSSSVFHIKEFTVPAAHIREYARATSLSQDEELLQHVKQYTPKDNPNPKKGDITIIGAHANGFPKELYEPLWEDFYEEAKAQGFRIRSIYIADAAWQGQSGIINRSKLGNDPSWLDYTRDILHMINTVRPPRPLIGIGHSFGAAALVNASLTSPRLFTSLVLLDPVMSRWSSTPGEQSAGPAALSIYRRDVWPTRAAALESFLRSPFYRSWDPRALDLWSRYGIQPTDEENPDGEVTLTTTKHQEVFTYLRPSWHVYDPEGKTLLNQSLTPDLNHDVDTNTLSYPVTLTWPLYRPEPTATLSRLPHLRPSVCYVFGLQSSMSPPELREEKLRLTGTGVGGSGGIDKGRVKAVLGENNGHLIPLETPRFCAREAARWVKGELARWSEEEKEYEEWTRKSQTEKSTISEDYKKHAGRPPRKDKAKI